MTLYMISPGVWSIHISNRLTPVSRPRRDDRGTECFHDDRALQQSSLEAPEAEGAESTEEIWSSVTSECCKALLVGGACQRGLTLFSWLDRNILDSLCNRDVLPRLCQRSNSLALEIA
jgi:hypothetical protein